MRLLIESTLLVSLILLCALAVTALLRRRPAALRHWVLATAVACACALPLLEPWAPAWQLLPMPVALAPINHAAVESISVRQPAAATEISRVQPQPDAASRIPFSSVLLGIWLAGIVVSVSALLVAMRRLSRVAARSVRMTDPRWLDIASRVARAHGVGRPVVLLQSAHPTLLVTWGVIRPKVILPAVAPAWSAERIHIVLGHELAHIARSDWAWQMLGELLRSCYWFNPLLWATCRRLRHDSEQACDDAVLNLGVTGSDYATHLLDLARALRHPGPWLPAPAMASPSTLERRIRVMLDTTQNRHTVTPRARLVTSAALLAISILIAGLSASAQGFVSVSGSIADSQGAMLRDARLVLSNVETKAKYEVRSSATGEYEFLGVTPGNYVLETAVLGFRPVQQNLALSSNVRRDLALQIGTLEETVTVTGNQRQPSAPDETAKQAFNRELARQNFAQKRAECRPASATTGQAIGGQIRPPRKILDVRPQYPEALKAAGIGGIVTLVALIGTEGNVTNARAVDTSVHPELVNAAIDAVKQWEFDGTLLNCLPVEVEMTVSVGFDPSARP